MQFKILYDNPNESIANRLMKIRNIEDNLEDFLSPTYSRYWQDPQLLDQIETATQRIIEAINNQEKIMIFGDYDVDGIVSSYVMYTFFRQFVGYDQISIRLPHRTQDGYGIKKHHIDQIKSLGCSLIITVDNGITAIEEAQYAMEQGIDMIVTDHHHALDQLPAAYATVNPQVSPKMRFPEICGATVAFKVCMYLAKQLLDDKQTKQFFTQLLPFIAIATVADCMPLIDENRLIVMKGLEIMNTQRDQLQPSLRHLLNQLNIQQIDTFHIGFMIAPRLNATGRVGDATEGLQCLLSNDQTKHAQLFARIEALNNQRRATQDEMIKQAQSLIDPGSYLLTAAHEEFHEGIVGIVAGRLAERFYKPSLVMGIDTNKGIATGSLRGPDYFNIVEMLQSADDLLVRYGGHAQAGGLTVALDNMETLVERFQQYCENKIDPDDLVKTLSIDTRLYEHELNTHTINEVIKFGPYGEGNPEPSFLIDNVTIEKADTVGKNNKSHLKLQVSKGESTFTVMQRSKGDKINQLQYGSPQAIIGKIKEDTYKGGFFVDAKQILPTEALENIL